MNEGLKNIRGGNSRINLPSNNDKIWTKYVPENPNYLKALGQHPLAGRNVKEVNTWKIRAALDEIWVFVASYLWHSLICVGGGVV